ncbi:type II toxin-antitoxin system RelE/ParE family toxin [Candidatus Woesearchaeota archaeon]|nr:type II toxin-antitoxin system RelE/ParE family toxin [Candidatus Woesearchaeota archaeon]
MSYEVMIHPKCQDEISKACSKNPVLKKAIENKISEIIQNPQHYKPLRYDLAGERRVHIMKSYVLRFEIDELNKTVIFLAFSHHDDAYKR